MKRSIETDTILGVAVLLMIGALSGCHSPASNRDAAPPPHAPVPVASNAQSPQPRSYNPAVGQSEASGIDGNPNLTPAQKAAAKANLQQEYGGAVR